MKQLDNFEKWFLSLPNSDETLLERETKPYINNDTNAMYGAFVAGYEHCNRKRKKALKKGEQYVNCLMCNIPLIYSNDDKRNQVYQRIGLADYYCSDCFSTRKEIKNDM